MAGTQLAAPGSYQQYKRDTNIFLTWLEQAATACGYKHAAAAKSRAHTDIPVKEILEQARTICRTSDPSFALPKGVARIARRAVSLRSVVTKQFEWRTQEVDEAESTLMHAFFTKILKESVDLLEEHRSSLPKTKPTRPRSHPSSEEAKLTNLFQCLDIEEIEDDNDAFDDLLGQSVPATPTYFKGKVKKKATSSTTEPLPHDQIDLEDLWMRINCFFHDLHGLGDQVIEAWVAGKAHPIAASMTMNAAIALAEQMELELLEYLEASIQDIDVFKSPLVGHEWSNYSLITSVAFFASSGQLLKPHDPCIAMTEKGAFYFYDVGLIMSKLAKSISYAHRGAARLSKKGVLAEVSPYHWPRVPNMEIIFLAYSKLDVATDDPKLKSLEKTNDILTQAMVQTYLYNKELVGLSNGLRHAVLPQSMDFATQAVIHMEDGRVSVAGVFAWSVLYSLKSRLGDRRPAMRDSMFAESKKSFALVEHVFKPHEYPHWQPRDLHHASVIKLCHTVFSDWSGEWEKRLFDFISHLPKEQPAQPNDVKAWIQNAKGRVDTNKQRKARAARIQTMKQVYMKPIFDAMRMCETNILGVGTWMYKSTLAREQAGISLANSHLTIVFAAYLFCALRQTGCLTGETEFLRYLDRVLDIHKKAIFFGEIPDTGQRFYSSFMLRIGCAATTGMSSDGSFTHNNRGGDRTGKLPARKAKAACLSISDTGIILDAWFKGEETAVRSVHAIKSATDKANNCKTGSRKPFGSRGVHDVLRIFNDQILQEVPRYAIDYITFTGLCDSMLQAVEGCDPYDQLIKAGKNEYTRPCSASEDLVYLWRIPERILFIGKHVEEDLKHIKQPVFRTYLMTGKEAIKQLGVWCQECLKKSQNITEQSGNEHGHRQPFVVEVPDHESTAKADGPELLPDFASMFAQDRL